MMKNNTSEGLRVIQTGRDQKSINEAARSGFRPLIKKLEPSNQIRSKFAVIQNKETGEIDVIGDYRALTFHDSNDVVIPFTPYYPYNFPSPYAAYLLPPDLKVGEVVMLEDLIEDFVGARWNQGDTYRLDSCKAVWNGDDFEILYEENTRQDFVG